MSNIQDIEKAVCSIEKSVMQGATIPAMLHEQMMLVAEREKRRLTLLIVFLVALLVVTNSAWFCHTMYFTTTCVNTEQV